MFSLVPLLPCPIALLNPSRLKRVAPHVTVPVPPRSSLKWLDACRKRRRERMRRRRYAVILQARMRGYHLRRFKWAGLQKELHQRKRFVRRERARGRRDAAHRQDCATYVAL